MAVTITQASIDERGRASGGQAGDQTGGEVNIGPWYYFGQNVILRPTSPAIADVMVAHAMAIARNKYVGYDQGQRTTLYTAWKKVGWSNPDKITTPCECDCSALIAACAISAGLKVSPDCYTGNLRAALLATGKFKAFTAEKYLKSSDYIVKGDVILAEGKHVVIANSSGSKASTPAAPEKKPLFYGYTRQRLNVYRNKPNWVDTGEDLAKGVLVYCYATYSEKKAHYDGRNVWVWWAINPECTQWVVYTGRIDRNKVLFTGTALQGLNVYDSPVKPQKKVAELPKGATVNCYATKNDSTAHSDGQPYWVWWRITPLLEAPKWVVYTKRIKRNS